MARIRTIKPEFFTDADVAALDPLIRLFFVGLWCQADKAGRLKDRPADLKVRILPFDEIDPEGILAKLEDAKFIRRYGVDGCGYIQIRTWCQHQRPHKFEAESTLPSCDGTRTVQEHTHDGPSTALKEGKGKERKGKEGKGRTVEGPSAGDTPAPPSLGSFEFSKPLDTHKFILVWGDWMQHRKEIGKPLTSVAVKRQLNRLAKLGVTRAIQVIEHTIGHNWAGLREPDPDPGEEQGIDVQAEMDERRKEVAENKALVEKHPVKPMSADVKKAMS